MSLINYFISLRNFAQLKQLILTISLLMCVNYISAQTKVQEISLVPMSHYTVSTSQFIYPNNFLAIVNCNSSDFQWISANSFIFLPIDSDQSQSKMSVFEIGNINDFWEFIKNTYKVIQDISGKEINKIIFTIDGEIEPYEYKLSSVTAKIYQNSNYNISTMKGYKLTKVQKIKGVHVIF